MQTKERAEERNTPLIIDPSKEAIPEGIELSTATIKLFIFDQTPDDEKFMAVVEEKKPFWKRLRNGNLMQCWKGRGKGFPGGKLEETDRDDTEAACREGEEETGIPRDIISERLTDTRWTQLSPSWEDHRWTLIYCKGEGVENYASRERVSDPNVVKIYKWDKFIWARFADLKKNIFVPSDPREREERRAAGDVWFYTSHTVALLAMLLQLEREDLFETTIGQIATLRLCAYPMLELFKKTNHEDIVHRRITSPRFSPTKDSAFKVVKNMISAGCDELADILIERTAPPELKNELIRYAEGLYRNLRGPLHKLYQEAATQEGSMQKHEEVEARDHSDSETELETTPRNPFLDALRMRQP